MKRSPNQSGGKKRRYSDEDRGSALAALDANNGNIQGTAELLGIPRKTLEGWAKDRSNEAVAEIRRTKKQELAQNFEDIAFSLLAAANKRIGEMSPSSQITAAAIATDKWLLLNDMPNGIQKITGAEDISDDEIDRLLGED